MSRFKVAAAILLVLILASPAMPANAQVIGVVKTIRGSASIIRNNLTIPASIGIKLQVNDTLLTDKDGSLGVIFRDDSVLSMGPCSRLVIDQFLFSPAEGKLGFLIKIIHGTIDYLSGMIGKLSAGTAKFETPVATIGIRGTHFAAKV